MSPRFLPLIVALCALGGCFTPEYHCRILCNDPGPGECPTGFTCETNGIQRLCARTDIKRSCFAEAPDAGTPDAPNLLDAGEAPAQLCYGTNCFELSPETRKSLVLWLDPSNLPEAGVTVGRWPDRSGRRNDALALSPSALPRSAGNGLEPFQGPAGSLRILQDPSLDFGTNDFAVLIVARAAATSPSCFYATLDGNRADPRGVELRWGYSSGLSTTTFFATINRTELDSNRAGLGDQRHLFVLRRVGGMAELRLNGESIAFTPLAGPAVSTTTDRPIYLGGCSDASWPVISLHAVVALNGETSLLDLMKLEAFLLQSFPRAP